MFFKKYFGGLPPARAVQLEVEMEPDGIQSREPRFACPRRSRDVCDQERLGRIFKLTLGFQYLRYTKKDHFAGQAPNRGEWLCFEY